MRERIETYLTYLANEEEYSANTIAAYRNDLGQFVGWVEQGGRPADDWARVGPETVTSYLFHLREREYATSTIARKVAALKSFIHHLLETEEIRDDPTADIDTPKVKKDAPEALSRDGLARLMAAPASQSTVKGLRDRAMLELLYATGLRVSELVSLSVDDLDLVQLTIRCGKGQNERTVPLGVRAVGPLNDYLESGRAQLTHNDEERTLFLNMRGGQLTRQGLWLIIKFYVGQAGIHTAVTPHTLRHSFAIHRLREGSELAELKGLLGHANISTTQVYAQGRVRDEG